MDSVDDDCGIISTAGFRSSGSPEVAVEQITKDLVQIGAFKWLPERMGHPTFMKFSSSNLIQQLDYRDFHSWMKDNMGICLWNKGIILTV